MPTTEAPWSSALRADLRANRGRPREQLILGLLRITQGVRERHRFLGILSTVFYRFVSEVIFNVELRPETKIGPGLRIFHSTGLVVETGSVIGANVKLHHNVTIGVKRAGGNAPVIEDGVEVGVGALILGGVTVGENAQVGAGALVVRDVPADHIARAEPASSTPRRKSK